jgi:hypothetical protein
MAQTDVATREAFFKALRAKGIDYLVDQENPVFVSILPNEEGVHPQKLAIPDPLPPKLVCYLWWHYKIPIHWFWNPIMIPGDEDQKPPC